MFLDQENVFHEWPLRLARVSLLARRAIPIHDHDHSRRGVVPYLGKDGASSARDLITGKITYQELAINMAEDVAVSMTEKFWPEPVRWFRQAMGSRNRA